MFRSAFRSALLASTLLAGATAAHAETRLALVIGQPAYSEIPGYGIANGRISLSPANRDFEFGIYGRNLFDTYYSAAFQQYSTLSLVHYIARDAHRTVGVFAKFGF